MAYVRDIVMPKVVLFMTMIEKTTSQWFELEDWYQIHHKPLFPNLILDIK